MKMASPPGNWKTRYKASDLADHQRLEMTCKKCNRLVYINKAMISSIRGHEQLYLDELNDARAAKLKIAVAPCAWQWCVLMNSAVLLAGLLDLPPRF